MLRQYHFSWTGVPKWQRFQRSLRKHFQCTEDCMNSLASIMKIPWPHSSQRVFFLVVPLLPFIHLRIYAVPFSSVHGERIGNGHKHWDHDFYGCYGSLFAICIRPWFRRMQLDFESEYSSLRGRCTLFRTFVNETRHVAYKLSCLHIGNCLLCFCSYISKSSVFIRPRFL